MNSGSCIDSVKCTLQDSLGPLCSSDSECPSDCGTCEPVNVVDVSVIYPTKSTAINSYPRLSKLKLFIRKPTLFIKTKLKVVQIEFTKAINSIKIYYERLCSNKLFNFLRALTAVVDLFSDFLTIGFSFAEGDYGYAL